MAELTVKRTLSQRKLERWLQQKLGGSVYLDREDIDSSLELFLRDMAVIQRRI
jgi:hypothetical protein